MSFDQWWQQCGVGGGFQVQERRLVQTYSKDAWEAQQKRIDELEERLTTSSEAWEFQKGKIEEKEAFILDLLLEVRALKRKSNGS